MRINNPREWGCRRPTVPHDDGPFIEEENA